MDLPGDHVSEESLSPKQIEPQPDELDLPDELALESPLEIIEEQLPPPDTRRPRFPGRRRRRLPLRSLRLPRSLRHAAAAPPLHARLSRLKVGSQPHRQHRHPRRRHLRAHPRSPRRAPQPQARHRLLHRRPLPSPRCSPQPRPACASSMPGAFSRDSSCPESSPSPSPTSAKSGSTTPSPSS